MGETSLDFITCLQLREEYNKCRDDINKRVLVIDVRDKALYDRSHLCLDARNCTPSVSTKTRVMNIDPDTMRFTTIANIKDALDEHDLRVFKKRRDATDVILIDRNTDDIDSIRSPKSKIMRMIVALTRLDPSEEKIIVPIQILEGGYKQWLAMYPHWTTDPTFDPEALPSDFEIRKAPLPTPPAPSAPPAPPLAPLQSLNSSSNNYNFSSTTPQVLVPPEPATSILPKLEHSYKPITPPQAPKPIISKVVPPMPTVTTPPAGPVPSAPPVTPSAPPPLSSIPTTPTAPKPNIVKIAPGTAVPVTPVQSLRAPLPRSNSSPNVAQADGDELESALNQLDKIDLSKFININSNINNNHLTHPTSNYTSIISKPRFDRTLKPAFDIDSVNAIRAQLNFGRSPEASGKAITGLQNLGNTCFMNSVIQCLSYCPGLAPYLCSKDYYKHINFNSQYGTKGELAIEFGALVEKLNSHHHRYIEPKSFRESIVKHIGFAGNEQQDSHEFMMMLFDKLHHDLAKDKSEQNGIIATNCNGNNDDSNINIPRVALGYQFWQKYQLDQNKSIVSKLFEGIFMSTLTCSYCKGQSNTFEVFNCLSLPIPSESRCHLKDCLSHFSNPERIEAAWECPRCKQKREADKKIVICRLPKILIIHLKRFSLDGRWRQKLQTTVDFPLNDLTVDCTNVLPLKAYESGNYKSSYNLYAVVNHFGHLDGGHYTAFCKLENQRWYTFDDSNVSEMKDTDVCGQSAYILFYAARELGL